MIDCLPTLLVLGGTKISGADIRDQNGEQLPTS